MVAHYIIEGKVQGVGFRWFVFQEAIGLGLRGWVRNTVEGSVEAMVEGYSAQLATLRSRLLEGPPSSAVSRVLERPVEPGSDAPLGPFHIRP